MPKTSKVQLKGNQSRVMAWNVDERVLRTLDLYAMASGITKYEIVEQALIEYLRKKHIKATIKQMMNNEIL